MVYINMINKKIQTIERIVLYIIILMFSINIAVNYKSPYLWTFSVGCIYIYIYCHWNRTWRYQTCCKWVVEPSCVDIVRVQRLRLRCLLLQYIYTCFIIKKDWLLNRCIINFDCVSGNPFPEFKLDLYLDMLHGISFIFT